eukprot:1059854-Heterocapsa_arctica.AAC.1
MERDLPLAMQQYCVQALENLENIMIGRRGRAQPPGARFIELFAGSCRVSLAVARLGIQSESFEILRSLMEDVTSVENTSSLLNRIQRRRVGCRWAGIACASWSRARRGKG